MKASQRLKNWAARLPKRASRPRLPEECTCGCHRGAMILHAVDCCKTCPHCRRRISTAFYNAHAEKCGATKRTED